MSAKTYCIIPQFSKYDWGALWILFCLTILFNPTLFFLSYLPLDGDSLLFFYPLRALHADHSVGLWNPYLFCGFPREANPQSQLLYPFNLLFYFVSTARGYSLLIIVHLFLGSAFLFILLRGLRCSTSAALIGAVAFLVSTYWRCKITNLGLLEGINWVPAILFCYLHALERKRWIYIPLASIFFSLIFLAGVPHTILYVVIFLLCISITYSISDLRRITAITFYFCTLMFFTLLNSIAVWLPAIYYAPEAARIALPIEEALAGSLHWHEIWRSFFGGLSQPDISRCDPWESTCYIGISALMLTPFGCLMLPKRMLYGLGISLIIAIVFTIAEDGYVYRFLYQYVPGFSYFNMPNRSLLIAAIILPLLSGLGFQYLLNRRFHSIKILVLLIFLALISVFVIGILGFNNHWVWYSLLYSGMTTTFQPDSISPSFWALVNLIFWLAPTSIVLIPLFMKNGKVYLSVLLFVVLVVAQSYQYNQRLFLETTSFNYFDHNKNSTYLNELPNTSYTRNSSFVPFIDVSTDVRCRFIQPALMHRLPEVYQLKEIQGYDPLYPKRYGELIRAWAGQSPSVEPIRKIRTNSLPHAMLDFLGVEHVIGYPNQRQLFTGQFDLNQPDSIQSPFPAPTDINKISIRWLAAGAFHIPQGAHVGDVHIISGTEETQIAQTFPIRMGIEIANYITLSNQERAKHRPANIFRWFPIPSMSGYDHVHQYVTDFDLQETITASAVAIEWYPQATLAIREINYYLPSSPNLILIETDSELPLYHNPTRKGPVYLSRNIMRYENVEEIVEILNHHPNNHNWPIFIERDLGLTFDTPPISNNEDNWSSIKVERSHSDKINIEIDTKYDALLAIHENYSNNWNATLNKKPVEIIRANHSFMAVAIPAGEHLFQLNYMPRLFYIACSISGICLTGIIILILLHGKRIFRR